MPIPCARVEQVMPGSLAERMQICAGDIIRTVNGQPLRDLIDYEYATADDYLLLEVETPQGQRRDVAIHKDYDDDLGIVFGAAVFDGTRLCGNRCLFCFVDQMRPGCRDTLYVKDDDYRLSFLYGNYITMTNLRDEDYQRIVGERLSPLFISIHSTEPTLHAHLLGLKKPFPLLEKMRFLAENGVGMHGQIVLTPGLNDGEALACTVADFAALGDAALSLALVPVGLTRYKNPQIRPYTPKEAAAVIDFAEGQQQRFLEERGTRLVFAADEFYLLAGRELPSDEDYEEYDQIENGVGLARDLEVGFSAAFDGVNICKDNETLVLITGVAGAGALKLIMPQITACAKADLLTVVNTFFGDTVTVTGLLAGCDIADAILRHQKRNCRYLLPDIVLKHGENVLLDDMTIDELQNITGARIDVVPVRGDDFAAFLGGNE